MGLEAVLGFNGPEPRLINERCHNAVGLHSTIAVAWQSRRRVAGFFVIFISNAPLVIFKLTTAIAAA